MDTAALDADQTDTIYVSVALGDLVGDPRQAALDRISVENGFSVRHSEKSGYKKTNRSEFCWFATYSVVELIQSCPFATSRDHIKGNK